MTFFDVNQHGEADLVTENGRHDENTESDDKSSVYEKLHLLPNFAVIKVLFRWFLWLSTDFGDFPTFWWGGHLKLGVSRKRDKEPATDDTRAPKINRVSQIIESVDDFSTVTVIKENLIAYMIRISRRIILQVKTFF